MSNDYNGKKRSELPDSVFGIPQERKYPMPDEKHTRSAIKLFNHVDPKYEEQLAKAVIKNMKKYGIDGSVVGPNNRLRKYLPKDMIKESIDPILQEYMYTDNEPDITVHESGYALTFRILPILFKAAISGVDQYDYKYLREKKLPAILKKCKTMDDIKYMRRDATMAKTQMEILKRNVHAVNINDEQAMKRLSKSFIKKVKDGKITEKEIDTHIRWLGTEYKRMIDDRAKEIKDSMKESSILEGYLKSDKDIYYNKDRFDSGEINLCFITGLIGSGKTTMSKEISSKNIERYEIDDVIFNDCLSNDVLKDKKLLYLFFNGIGKKYRYRYKDNEYNHNLYYSFENYEKDVTIDFVKYSIEYASSCANKIIIDGIWIYLYIDPKLLSDYAVCIKGTSMIKSSHRATNSGIQNKIDKGIDLTVADVAKKYIFRIKKDLKFGKMHMHKLKSFRSYFEKQSTNESYVEESSHNKVYHLSQTNLDGKTIQPTVPSNYMTVNGYEDSKTKRVCFSTSIDGCLRALSQKCEGMKLFVHIPDGNYNIYKPSNKEVPDASITGEVWIKKAVKMKCIGQIYVIGDKGEDGIPYKYGDKTAELYDWEWKWIDKFNESVSILPQDTGISTVIFDIGDVLVSANIKDYLIADPEVPNEIVDELLKLWFIDKDEVDDTMDLDTYREIVNKRMGVEFSKYIPKLFQYNVDCVTAFDYTIPMIQDLKDKGYKVYYLSNWSAWTYDLLQEAGKFDFLKLMDGGVFSYDAGYMKPNEEIYKILLNKYKINPEEAVFFDDREENIEAANKLGIHGVHFPRHDSSIVYNSLTNNAGNYEYTTEKFIMSKNLDEQKVAKEILNTIKPIIITPQNKSKASKLGLTLKCRLEEVDSGMVFVLVLDGSQDKRDTDEAKAILKDLASKCRFKLSDIVSKVDIGDGDEGCLYFTIDKTKIKRKRKDLLQEYGTTGGTIVGSNQPDSVYIVNYMQNNVFSGYKEHKRAICKKGMNQMYTTNSGKAIPVDIDKFKEEASDISIFKFKGTPVLSYDQIIENASTDNDFYLLLTGDSPEAYGDLEYDNRFVQEENFFDELRDITFCTESTITGQIESSNYPYMKILTESMDGRSWNFYRDINGVFAMNELTGLRTPSYENAEEIPKSQIKLIERGTVYFGDQ